MEALQGPQVQVVQAGLQELLAHQVMLVHPVTLVTMQLQVLVVQAGLLVIRAVKVILVTQVLMLQVVQPALGVQLVIQAVKVILVTQVLTV